MTYWRFDEYLSWINDGCPINTSVITLDLQESSLISIVNQINNLPNLSTLNLGSNNITNLPDEIGDLKKLKNLYLSYNNISNLPSFEFLDLEYFECQFNNLTYVDIDISLMTNIKYLCYKL